MNERPKADDGNLRTLALIGIVVLAGCARLVPHPPNFTPIGAVALFGAAHFRSRWLTFLVPLAAMFLSDLGLQTAGRTGFHQGTVVVYGTIVLIAALGLLLRRKNTVVTVAGVTLASSVLFFVITNFGVWAEGALYPMTSEGLFSCYIAAIPFFHWTLLGDAFFVTVLFGGFLLAERRFPLLQPATS